MLKFFRRIRQNQLLEGKTSRYFKYAIGETILVVIGILIALGINNWNENRIAQNQAKTYLVNLDEEIKQNIKLLEAQSKIITNIIDITHYYHSKLIDKNEEVHDTVISNFILKINPINTLNPSQTVLRDYLNSGLLKDLNNTKLKNNILFLESRYKDFSKDLNSINDKYKVDIEPYLLNYGDYTEFVDSLGNYKIKKANFGHQRNAFINNKILSNKLIWYIGYLDGANSYDKNTQKKLKQLSDRINNYITND